MLAPKNKFQTRDVRIETEIPRAPDPNRADRMRRLISCC
jgi:hypothetical protein